MAIPTSIKKSKFENPPSSPLSSSSSDEDSSFKDDMESIRRACILTGTTNKQDSSDVDYEKEEEEEGSTSSSSSEVDDVELVKNIQKRLNFNNGNNNSNGIEPVFMKPLVSLPPMGLSDSEYEDGDDEDDYETLRAIEQRFANYQPCILEKNTKTSSNESVVVQGSSVAVEQGTSHLFSLNRSDGQDFSGSEEACNTSFPMISFDDTGPWNQSSGSTEWHQPGALPSATASSKYSSFPHPKSANFFINAIKKNRSFQKLIRSKLIQIEAKIEENRKLKERVKLLKDFQLSCKKRAGRALSQKKDARIQLISACKSKKKVQDKKVSALCLGPVENSHVANYRMVMERFPLSLRRDRWSDAERENLGKGIKQQFQEMLMQKSLEYFSDPRTSAGDSSTLDNMIASITDLEFPPENVRSFLPKVDWERLASLYVVGRSGAECEARWLNHEDPLVNHSPWDKVEDKNLLFVLQQWGIHNWIDISTKMGTKRTPYQCFARYQRSLNANIIKRDWTEEDDAQLRAAVEAFGEKDWQLVASNMEGRTGTQCSNRWKKTLIPARERVGRWTVEEDKRLKVAVMLFSPKTWNKIAQFVPGRTQVQCRERWVNVLDSSLNLERWTEEEDCRLKEAIAAHGHCWSKVAAAVPPRTDNQCRRRWKFLFPHELLMRQAARRVQKVALISNFVDREAERPALDPSDFLPLPGTNVITEAQNGENNRRKKKEGRKPSSKKQNDMAFRDDAVSKKKNVRKRHSKSSRHPEPPVSSKGLPSSAQSFYIRDVDDDDNDDDVIFLKDLISTKKREALKQHSKKKSREPGLCDQELPLGTATSTGSKIKDDVYEESFFVDETTSKKKRKRKLISEKKKSTEHEMCGHQELPFSPESLILVKTSDGNEDETLATMLKKEKGCKPRAKRKMCAEHLLSDQEHKFSLKSSATVKSQFLSPSLEEPKSAIAGRSLNVPLTEVDMPQQIGSNKSRNTGISQSKEISELVDDEEEPLASFLRNKVKRRKLRPADRNGQGTLSPLGKRKIAPKILCGLENTNQPAEDQEKWLHGEHSNSEVTYSSIASLVETAGILPQERFTKLRTEDVFLVEEIPGTMEGDMTLASFLNKKKKKRRHERATNTGSLET
ncbi:hypothetical protein IFM89_007088 [Coptis chinensis]|uniref:Uncharacterized protein n=1 Tax=Coptis chinensis TaxID=261450 RepID=A0A835LDR1_9MAGN|nr:hypothetical protein IFM89_007088 [Coptis chinensis]